MISDISHPFREPLLLIVNGDDLGASAAVNGAICDLMRQRVLTSVSMLANAPFTAAAAEASRHFPEHSFGVHLNVTEYTPLSPDGGVRPLLGPDGRFRNVIREVDIDSALREGIYREWCAQIDRLLDLRVDISHIDSHHHVHNIPQLLPVLKKLRQKYGISRARLSKNMYGANQRATWALRFKKRLYNCALRQWCGFRTADGFGEFMTLPFVHPAQLEHVRVLELMTHPGHPQYVAETQFLRSGWRNHLPCEVRLITYRQLPCAAEGI